MREGEAPSELAVEAARLIGRTIGSYRVVRLLGAGGMGAVYLGEHPGIGSKVAIKLLHPRFAADKGMIERFFNEARAVNVIGHDNIIKVLDFSVTADGRHFFVMEFLHGHTLESLLHQRQPLPLTVTAPIFLQCCRALQAAHERGIVHRDLKPDNVFLTRHGDREHFVKLLDFGIAKLSDVSASRRTQTGVVLGTPEYMSPEQAAGDVNSIDARSDIYSLGVMMFEGATGRTPFGGPGVLLRSILNGHVSRPPPAPRSLAPGVPEAYERVVLRCLEKEPASRWQSMADLHRAIEETLRALRLVAERPMVHPEQQLHTTVAEEVTAAEPEAATAKTQARSTPSSDELSQSTFPPPPRGVPSGTDALVAEALPSRRRHWLLGAAAAVLALGGGLYAALRDHAATPPRADPVGASTERVEPVQAPSTAVPAAAQAEPKREPAIAATPPPPAPARALAEPPAAKAEPPPARPREDPPRKARGSRTSRQRAKAAAPEPVKTEPPPAQHAAAAEAQRPMAAPAAVVETVRLFVVSRPHAALEATWPGGSQRAQTPRALDVPKGAQIKLVLSAPGYESAVRELTAAAPQAVTIKLTKSK